MNIELKFLQKAVKDKNYISFMYEKRNYKKIKPLKLENQELLYTDNEKFDFAKISKLMILKDRF